VAYDALPHLHPRRWPRPARTARCPPKAVLATWSLMVGPRIAAAEVCQNLARLLSSEHRTCLRFPRYLAVPRRKPTSDVDVFRTQLSLPGRQRAFESSRRGRLMPDHQRTRPGAVLQRVMDQRSMRPSERAEFLQYLEEKARQESNFQTLRVVQDYRKLQKAQPDVLGGAAAHPAIQQQPDAPSRSDHTEVVGRNRGPNESSTIYASIVGRVGGYGTFQFSALPSPGDRVAVRNQSGGVSILKVEFIEH
jgi:hypothetical protein